MESWAVTLELSTNSVIILILVIIWSMIWKGVALWKSAQLSQKNWFIALLIINTVGILEIYYIYYVANKSNIGIETEEDTIEIIESKPADEEETEV